MDPQRSIGDLPSGRRRWSALARTTLLLGGFGAVSSLGVAAIDAPMDTLRGPLGGATAAGTVLLATLCHVYRRLTGAAPGARRLPTMSRWAVAGTAVLVLGWLAAMSSLLGYDPLLSPLPLHLLAFAGLLVASGGVARALSRACEVQRARLLQAEYLARCAEDRAQAELARQAERAHEARNALVAIEGATCMLHDGADRMAALDRDQLTAAISAEIARLRRLVTGDTSPDGPRPFDLADALSAVVACERSLGATIQCDIAVGLTALGSPSDTAAAVQNLLQNARRYGGSEVTIRATTDEEQVVLHVRDQGAGIPAEDRDLVFERGWRGARGTQLPGSGLGLHVARGLMERQGGELRLEPEDDRCGACFTLRLPGVASGAALRPVADLPADELTHDDDQGGWLGRRHVRLVDPIEEDANDVTSFVELHDATSGHLIG